MHPSRTAALLTVLAALAACDKARQVPPGTGEPPVEVAAGDPAGGSGGGTVTVTVGDCTRCHGTKDLVLADADPLVAAAPPLTARGELDAPAVGAHRAHLVNGALRNAMECASCHLVPTRFPHPAQAQGKLSFSRLATTVPSGPPLAPTWNGTSCASTYCHGNFRGGAGANPIAWSGGGAAAQCGSCHGIPPGGSHPQDAPGAPLDCGRCHSGYTRTTVNVALHVNGRVDGGGHPAGWIEPDQHGLAALRENLTPCATCHTGFGPATGAGSSCDGCHADPALYGPYATGTYGPHPSWETECTFCHGGRDGASGAPPRDTHVVSSDTTTPQATTDATIGAHTSHVGTAASSPETSHGIAAGLDCTACHATRWASALDPGHVDKTTADVVFGPVGAAANAGSYARPSCASTYCHGDFRGGAGAGAVAWTGDFGANLTLSCASCHGAPPVTSATVPHPPNPSCGSCHAGYTGSTVNAATHVDGAVQHAPATGCTQCHGDLGASGVARTDVRAAPGTDASATDAHGSTPTDTGARGIGAHARHLTGTRWRAAPILCGECHAVPADGDTSHASGTAALTFGGLASTAWAGQPAITPVWNGAGGAATLTCASTYCHGAFKNGANATPTWTAAGSVGCGDCHGIPPGGNHPALGTGQTCGSCHGAGYASGVDPALHMNGVLDLANLTCSTCHGSATRTPVASASALDALGAPLVRASPPIDAGHGAAAVGAHLAHVNQDDALAPGPLSNAIPCASCHQVPTSIAHATGTVNVTFSGLSTTGGVAPAAYDFAGHSCSSTYCHGNFRGGAGANPIAWTATGKLACGGCHGAPPATSATVPHPPNPSCGACHASYSASSVNVATHVDGIVQHAPATGCTQCHGDLGVNGVANTDVRAAPAGDANAVDAHGNLAATAPGVGAHGKHLTGTTWRQTPIACNECHAVPATGDTTHVTGTPTLTFGTLARTAWSGPALSPAFSASALTCSSTYCHGAFPNGANDAPTWNVPGSVGCGSCHGASATNGPGGTHPTLTAGQNCGTCHGGSYTNTSVDPALHMNGVMDGGGESSGGTSCGGCHGTIWNAMNGSTAKVSRHALLNDVPNDSSVVWTGATLSAVAPASRSCVNMCHGDHPHDLPGTSTTHEYNAYLDATTPSARGGTTRTTSTRDAGDFDAAAPNGGMCASCHQRPIVAGGTTVPRAAFDASAHDYSVNTVGAATYTWRYALHDGGPFVRDCTKCHASSVEGTTPTVTAAGSATAAVHFGDNASLLAGTTRPAGTPAGFVCYNCHGSAATPAAGAQGNRSGKDIQTQILHATTTGQSGHPANSDSVHDSVAEQANAAFGNALGVAAGSGQRHASCLDCHDPHETRAGTHAAGTNLAGPPLQGAWGARLSSNPAFWTAPGSGNFTKTTIAAGTDVEATLCFKCHSSYYWGTGTAPTSPSGGFAETDTAREFNPANVGTWSTAGTTTTWSTGETAGGFHPVLASAGGNLGVTTNVKAPWTTTSLMTCSDCHESDQATDPNGPHGSAARFVLKGPQTTWNGTLTNAGTMPANAFCSNCHNTSWTTSRFPDHSRGDHYVACFNCHAAVPHGGPRPGMLVAPAGAATAVGGPIAGWDAAAPYYGLTSSSDRLYLVSYPTTQTGNWRQSNCGCNGTGH